jgi:hypothetical protein
MDELTLFDGGSAVISPCEEYRYELVRRWGNGPLLGWIMLNPSTADASQDDPTIRRCIGFAKAWCYDGIIVRNLFALRATDPRELKAHENPVGDDNLYHLGQCWQQNLTIAGWGGHRSAADLIATNSGVRAQLESLNLSCLGTTGSGAPCHPLYLRSDTEPRTYHLT